MAKEELKKEYAYWRETIKNIGNVTDRVKTSEEKERYHFARGFVSAVNKTGILR